MCICSVNYLECNEHASYYIVICGLSISLPVSFFYILLTVHFSIFILVINQLDAQNFCFTVSLFHASTCFECYVLIIRSSTLCYTTSGIITPIGVVIPEIV